MSDQGHGWKWIDSWPLRCIRMTKVDCFFHQDIQFCTEYSRNTHMHFDWMWIQCHILLDWWLYQLQCSFLELLPSKAHLYSLGQGHGQKGNCRPLHWCIDMKRLGLEWALDLDIEFCTRMSWSRYRILDQIVRWCCILQVQRLGQPWLWFVASRRMTESCRKGGHWHSLKVQWTV